MTEPYTKDSSKLVAQMLTDDCNREVRVDDSHHVPAHFDLKKFSCPEIPSPKNFKNRLA